VYVKCSDFDHQSTLLNVQMAKKVEYIYMHIYVISQYVHQLFSIMRTARIAAGSLCIEVNFLLAFMFYLLHCNRLPAL